MAFGRRLTSTLLLQACEAVSSCPRLFESPMYATHCKGVNTFAASQQLKFIRRANIRVVHLNKGEKALQAHEHYHQFIKSYQCRGNVYLSNRRNFECDFECGQTEEGDIVVYLYMFGPAFLQFYNDLDSVVHVSGYTPEGQYLRANVAIPRLDKVSWDSSGVSAVFEFYARELTFGNMLVAPLTALKFYLVNFTFVLPQKWHFADYDIEVSRVDSYNEAEAEMSATKRPKMTTELRITSPSHHISNEYEVERIVHDLCSLLSLAQGCQIQWLYWDAYTSDEVRVKSYHWNGITTPYSSWNIILELPPEDISDFVQQTFEHYREVNAKRIWKFDEAIGHYADTVSRNSLLELRAINLVVLVDYLTRSYAASQKINRRGFRSLLSSLLKHLGLEVNQDEVKMFVKIRNKLVHESNFLKPHDFPERSLYESSWRQFRRILSLTSRIMLAILQYRGYYHDWQKFKPSEWAGAETARVKMPYVGVK